MSAMMDKKDVTILEELKKNRNIRIYLFEKAYKNYFLYKIKKLIFKLKFFLNAKIKNTIKKYTIHYIY